MRQPRSSGAHAASEQRSAVSEARRRCFTYEVVVERRAQHLSLNAHEVRDLQTYLLDRSGVPEAASFPHNDVAKGDGAAFQRAICWACFSA